MPQPGEPGQPGAWERVLPGPDELGMLPDLFESELANLFDYCRALLGQDAEAIRTARSVLDSPHEPLPAREQRRAWLFGLARSLSLALRPPGSDGPSYLPRALIAASSQQADNGVLRAFRALTDRDREILDLVYRHGIRPADLPAVLILAAEEVYRCLAHAEEEFISLAAGPESGPGADLEDIAGLPLAIPPAAEAGEPSLADLPAPQFDGAALRRPVARRRALFATAAVIALAAVAGGVVLSAAPGHPAASNVASEANRRAGTHGSQAGRLAPLRHRSAPGQPVNPRPVASPTAMPGPTSSPSSAATAGLAVTIQPAPCPAGTKASFRWHYTANGSPGGWSGSATHACPGSFITGPQAMGNVQITPGTTLEAGYDLSVPGNKNSLTMTVSAAQVTFAVSCVSKAAPSVPSLTVLLQAQTYHIPNDQWYPSGDQTSPLVYQGSIAVPALCGPGGQISLAKGGTFSATLG